MTPHEKFMMAGGITGIGWIDMILVTGLVLGLGSGGMLWVGMLVSGGRGTAAAVLIGIAVLFADALTG